MATRSRWLLSLLLAGCGKAEAPPPAPMHTGGPCPQNHCISHPQPAPSQPAPGFVDCPSEMHVELTSQPNPRPFSAELTRQRRGEGQADACCYEAQRLCGGGRRLVVEAEGRVAALARGAWG